MHIPATRSETLSPNELTAKAGLIECLQRILTGPWRFIQLRGDTPDAGAIDDDDIDLLGAEESVEALTQAALGWVRAGLCHLRFVRQLDRKVEWTLFSLDGQHRLSFDLWVELNQLDRGRRTLRYRDVVALSLRPESAIGRLPVELEACLYVHHLISKRKDLSGNSVTGEDSGIVERLATSWNLRPDRAISDTERQTLAQLNAAVGQPAIDVPRRSRLRHWSRRLRSLWLSAPKGATMISIMGCDGAGKTTLAHTIGKQSAEQMTDEAAAPRSPFPPAVVFTGKHLYRKSLLYKLAVIFIRPLLRSSRENFDETLAPLVYLRACLSLRLRLLFRRTSSPRVLVDRSIVDFLYVERKSDHPCFSRWLWLTQMFGRRLATVHCIVSMENIRKPQAGNDRAKV